VSIELWVAFIALVGVILSGIVSIIVSRRTINTEFKKLRFEAKKTYDSKLLDKRIEVYPSLYFNLSDFIKKIHRKSVSIEMLQSLIERIEEWDSKNAIYFSVDTANVCYKFRSRLYKLSRMPAEDFVKIFAVPESVKELRDQTASLEFALKSDLGIYGIQDSDQEVYGVRFVTSFPEIGKKN